MLMCCRTPYMDIAGTTNAYACIRIDVHIYEQFLARALKTFIACLRIMEGVFACFGKGEI